MCMCVCVSVSVRLCGRGVLRGNSQKYTRPNVSVLNLARLDDFQWVGSLLWWR